MNLHFPACFRPMILFLKYWIEHITIGILYVKCVFSTRIFCMGVPYFADCPCGVWCRGVTTCLRYVGPLLRNIVLDGSWSVNLTWRKSHFFLFFISDYTCICMYLNTSQYSNNNDNSNTFFIGLISRSQIFHSFTLYEMIPPITCGYSSQTAFGAWFVIVMDSRVASDLRRQDTHMD